MKTHIKIVFGSTMEGFEMQVNAMLAKGWMLHGQTDSSHGIGYYQAMTFDPESEAGMLLGPKRHNPSF